MRLLDNAGNLLTNGTDHLLDDTPGLGPPALGGGGGFAVGSGGFQNLRPAPVFGPGAGGFAVSLAGLSGLVDPPIVVVGGVPYYTLVGLGVWRLFCNPGRWRNALIFSGLAQRITAYDSDAGASGTPVLDETLATGAGIELQLPLTNGLVIRTYGAGTVRVRV